MARRASHPPLTVFLNNRQVGRMVRQANGAIEFTYGASWLEWENGFPISLSLPLRETRFTGERVVAVFENLLPDPGAIRTRIAERVGAAGSDAYSLLAAIGRDCIGALQFLPDGIEPEPLDDIHGIPLDDGAIEAMLANLARAPLGLDRDDDFRISVAGAQEKTALLRHEGRWLKPTGTTPTTHLIKPRIGRLANGIDLTASVDNEYYCLRLMRAFGLEAAAAEIHRFGEARALVIERFDRRWARDGRLLRLPQEDCCQALSVPPFRKYESDGGPTIGAIIGLLRGSDEPALDQAAFLKAQILFWLIGATDGHAKNFSIALAPGGRFRMTPLYDVLTTQPSLDAHDIKRSQFKLAMAVGTQRKYRIADIHGRHFVETARGAGLPDPLTQSVIDDVRARFDRAFEEVVTDLPSDFAGQVHESVIAAAQARLKLLDTAEIELRD